ncbi:hypothetical protein [Pontixanthobacter sp. CEM42]|uniref:hypothetical protein n=1 Tax=Pontixanthobacter sp. CEM42 TaxID=2792077 RepID=UPI001ADF2DC0|nr:hypothetical protein [Pontixanthobacter sp. CEM42]
MRFSACGVARSAFVTISLFVASAASAQIGNSQCAQDNRDILNTPIISPSPTYISENDSDFEYRRAAGFRSRNGIPVYANSMVSDFVAIRGKLAEFQGNLEAAQREYWSSYDRAGRANNRLQNEVGYWLHKREVFEKIKSDVRFAVRGSGQSSGAVIDLLMGANASRGFNVPADLEYLPNFDRTASLSALLSDDSYRRNIEALSIYSFLTYSKCAPQHWGTVRGRVLHGLMYPARSGQFALSDLSRIEEANRTAGRTLADTEQYVNQILSTGSRTSYRDIAMETIGLRTNVGPSTIADRFESWFNSANFAGFEHDGPGYWQDSKYISEQTVKIPRVSQYRRMGSVRENYTRYSISVDIPRVRTEDVQNCYPINLRTLNRRLYELNGDSYAKDIQGSGRRPTSARRFVKTVAYYSCALPDGLENPAITTAAESWGWGI